MAVNHHAHWKYQLDLDHNELYVPGYSSSNYYFSHLYCPTSGVYDHHVEHLVHTASQAMFCLTAIYLQPPAVKTQTHWPLEAENYRNGSNFGTGTSCFSCARLRVWFMNICDVSSTSIITRPSTLSNCTTSTAISTSLNATCDYRGLIRSVSVSNVASNVPSHMPVTGKWDTKGTR